MVHALVLAAGHSRRMGRQKLLLPFDGQPLITRVVDAVLRSAVTRVWVVVGPARPRIAEALAGRPVNLVSNPAAEGDMLSSVRCGLKALPPGAEGVLVALGDQPGITPELIDAMLQVFAADPGAIVVPVHAGRRGHPVLVPVGYQQEIQARYEGVGLRGLLEAHPQRVVEVEARTASALMDLDSPEDYRRALARLSR